MFNSHMTVDKRKQQGGSNVMKLTRFVNQTIIRPFKFSEGVNYYNFRKNIYFAL